MITQENRHESTGRGSCLQTLRSAITPADIWILSGFAFFSLLYFLSQWKGATPYVFLRGDSANITSFAAGWSYQPLFLGDPVLGNADNFRFYATIHIPLTQLLAKATGDYGSAFIWTLGPQVFLQMVGFYFLGCVVFKNRYWAILLTIVTSATVYLPSGDYWGIYIEPIPRSTFQALLPFLLAAAFHYKNQPKAWPWIMAGAGALIYVHPVSAPGWGLALWLGFWTCRPTSWSFGRQLRYMLLASGTFFLIAVPWVIFYFFNHEHGASSDYETIVGLMRRHYNPSYLDGGLAASQFISSFWTHRGLCLTTLLLLSSLYIMARRSEKSPELKLIFTWIVGLAVSAIGITLIEQAIEHSFRMVPLQLDLIRGVRYIIPMLLLACLWCLYQFSKSTQKGVCRAAWPTAVLFTSAYTLNSYHFLLPPLEVLKNWRQGHLVVMPQEWQEVSDSLQAVKHKTPLHARLLPFGKIAEQQALSLRYYALRPVIYAPRDKAALGYANHKAFLEWNRKYEKIQAIANETQPDRQVALFLVLCEELKVNYCLMDSNLDLVKTLAAKTQQVKVIHRNPTLTLFQIYTR